LNSKSSVFLTEWTKLRLYDPSGAWTSGILQAVVTLTLCVPVLLGLLFLSHNNIVIDQSARTAIDKTTGFDLLNPTKFKTTEKSLITIKQNALAELKSIFQNKKQLHSIRSGMACTIDAQ
jgi:hypothetical protein